jgi:hypothetical protein
MIPRSTKPSERVPAGEGQSPIARKAGIPLSSLDLQSWPTAGGIACVAATTKPAAAGHEHPQPRPDSGTLDRSTIAQFAAASQPSPAVAATRAAADGIPSGPSASLAEIIQAWPKLPQPIQTALTAIIHAALGNRAG